MGLVPHSSLENIAFFVIRKKLVRATAFSRRKSRLRKLTSSSQENFGCRVEEYYEIYEACYNELL